MIDLDVPELEAVAVPLTLDERRTRHDGDPNPAPPELAGRVALGGPVAAGVSAALVAADPDLAAFVESQSHTTRYVLLHAAVTFMSGDDDPPLELASVEFQLAGRQSPQPIAWSMSPTLVTHHSQVSRTIKIGPQLKLAGAEIGGLGVEHATSHQTAEVFLEALRELRADPAWQFARTRTIALRGSHRLAMIVSAPRGSAAQATVTVRASIRRWRLLPYRAPLPNPIELPFDF